MPQKEFYDVPYPNILLEIEKSTKDYMAAQFEHNNYFSTELREHSIALDAITKQLDNISREVLDLQSKYASTKILLGKISDAQATLVNRMAAKLISLGDEKDVDLKMIGVSPIDSLFSKFEIVDKGTGHDPTSIERCPKIFENKDLAEKIAKSGREEIKTISSDAPTIPLDLKDFNYDNCSLIECISLLQSMVSLSHAYEQNRRLLNI
jgi:hypothetical protein